MKKLLLLIVFKSIAIISNGQRIFDDITNDKPQNAYIGLPVNEMKELNRKASEAYENNRDYKNKLIDFILDLKTKTDDRELLDAIETSYNNLKAIDCCYQDKEYQLDNISSEIKKAINDYNARIKDAPQKLWETANEDLTNQNYQAAIQKYSELIKNKSKFPDAYLNRGIAYSAIKNFELSILDLNKYIEIIPDNERAYGFRGWAKYYEEDFMGAMVDFNKQIELDPDNSKPYYNRGSVKSKLGDNKGAISDYTKAIEIRPNFSMAYNNRGWAKYQLKKYKEAIIDLDRAIQMDDKNWVAYDSRQETKLALNDLKGCIADCNIVISLNPKCTNSLLCRGNAYFKQGNKTKACEDWSNAGEKGEIKAYDFISKYCN